ncbi:tRNA1(Val) A37 N6-methylase TrmN6 [Scopulibacillus darangshiensis]|uniref:tRNA1(Val) A37 N6-methylase TrmN6 n=1 Tax=Scopulibacillus darangshiensis TaxID=442528 RepID=A0A4R2NLQ2_9BACL|nr:tRNA1(Val) (adenine(37)-N6)-methyltransferase [Scopulibacillus darangshiensis]TCP22563.1 tRNA1(Val) A37 N6-methylase TrmN6 [Scopulibacillus darangshiensis]
MTTVGENERVDNLFDTNLKVIQSNDVFAFSLDAVLLSRFVYVPIQKGKLIDLCTGNGAIPIMLTTRTKGTLTGIELQQRIYDMALRSASLNGLDDRISFICDDVKNAPERLGKHQFDIVTCNPPYFPAHQARDRNVNEHIAIARHEIHITLEEVISIAGELLKQKGKAAFVHRPERLIEIISSMKKNKVEPKRIQFVHPKKGKAANMVLIEGTKDGKEGITVLPPIHVYDENGNYTEDIRNGG